MGQTGEGQGQSSLGKTIKDKDIFWEEDVTFRRQGKMKNDKCMYLYVCNE